MLGSRTKQVFTYGKRNRRIVNDPENYTSRKENAVEDDRNPSFGPSVPSSTSAFLSSRSNTTDDSPQPRPPRRSRKNLVRSPTASPDTIVPNRRKVTHDSTCSPKSHIKKGRRPILASSSPNIPRTPVATAAKRKSKKCLSLKPPSPAVDVDIVLLDDRGHTLKQEKRVSWLDVTANTLAASSPAPRDGPLSALASFTVSVPDREEESEIPPSPISRQQHATLSRRPQKATSRDNLVPTQTQSQSSSRALSRAWKTEKPKIAAGPLLSDIQTASPKHLSSVSVEDHRPQHLARASLKSAKILPAPIAHHVVESPPLGRAKARQLTPIRNGRRNVFPPPSPPSPATSDDSFDMDFELEALDFSSTSTSPESTAADPHLQPLLTECAQSIPYEFSAFIDTFPYDAVVNAQSRADASFQKIGEASYSEVFGVGDVVLKIIPIRAPITGLHDVETPPPSEAGDVAREIVVTRAMGEACAGFTTLLRAYVVRGKYPSLLLDLWDEYNERKGSESIRPDMFTASQVYAIIALPNGGSDLESYSFSRANKTGWHQAASIFWQTARTLAEAEDAVAFEHRDLHWGQILVRDVATSSLSKSSRKPLKVSMDSLWHGVETTVIDLGLARMDPGEPSADVCWTPFDEEIFEGDGDYQYDVYRLMRDVHDSDWSGFRPLTNVMWLHYLALKLLKSKGLRAPIVKKPASIRGPDFSERECYESLVEVEELLARKLNAAQKPIPKKRMGKSATVALKVQKYMDICDARAVVQFGTMRGWLVA